MKIPPAVRRICRVLGCLMGTALAPLMAQTDDHGNTAATATVVNANTTVAGTITAGGDVDYFSFTVGVATHVAIYSTGAIDISGSLRNSADGEIVRDDDSGTFPNFRIERDLTPGTYYVRVAGFDATTSGPYVLNLEVDDGNTASNATIVNLNSTRSVTMYSNSDIDYFRFTIPTPPATNPPTPATQTRVVLYTTGTVNTVGSLRTLFDTEIVGNDNASVSDTNFRIVRDLDAGSYYLRVNAQSGQTGPYVLHVETSGLAVVTTATPTGMSETTVTLGGEVVSDGGATITERGMVFSKVAGPLVGQSPATTLPSGFGVGAFVLAAGGLTPGTTYYARAYATSAAGTTYGPEVQFLTLGTTPQTPVVDDHGDSFTTATVITPNSTTKGVLHSTNDADFFRLDLPAPADVFIITTGTADTVGRLFDSAALLLATDDNGAGSGFNFRIVQDLTAGTYYIVVTGNSIGSYTLTVQSTIRATGAVVTTGSVATITTSSAVLNGNISSDGGAPVTQRGLVYGRSPNPVINSGEFTTLNSGSGVGSFTATASGLSPDTRYYVRAFATNSAGTTYGSTVEFSTLDDHGNTAAGATVAALGTDVSGTLTSAGDVDYFRFVLPEARYVAVFTTGSADTAGSLRGADDAEIAGADGGGAGANFRIERSLAAGTYYVRVAAGGGGLGAYVLRIETSTTPVVATAAVTDLAPTGATLGGNVSNEGGTAVTQRGIVFSTTPNPTVANATVVQAGTGAGVFSATVALTDATTYYVRAFAANAAGLTYGNEVQFSTPPGTHLINLSVRGRAGEGEQALLVGFNLGGAGSKQLLVRGIGPTLGSFGVTGALTDPFLQLFSPQTAIASNEDWGGAAAISTAAANVGAFALPAASRDAALLQTLGAGTYTVRVGGGTGAALVEMYDTGTSWTPELTNVSTRSQVAATDVLIAGFTISGNGSRRVLIRGIGPTLSTFGVAGVMADPRVDVFRSGSALPIASNDNWGGGSTLGTAFQQVGAFALPEASRDAAMLLTLTAGSYTAQVAGVNSTAGVVLLEIYELP